MACDITSGRELPCKDGIGGIKNVYFANYGSVSVSEEADDSVLATRELF